MNAQIGHLELHHDLFSKITYSSIEEWITFFQQIPEEQYYWIEQHAYEFGGRLLVPREKLIEKLHDAVALARGSGFDAWDASGDSTRQYVAHGIAKYFEVSDQVIERRLIRENLWPPGLA
jgi:Zn-dependent peptidase ImmA (M78 family)